MTGSGAGSSFTLGYVPGVTPSRWLRTWQERSPEVPLVLVQAAADQAAGLVRDRAADAVLLRLPIDRTGLHAIPLYTETTVVVAPKDHWLAAADEVSTEDLADEVVLRPLDDVLEWERSPGRPGDQRPPTTEHAISMVAAEVGLLLVPQSLARLHHRKDVIYRPVADVPQSRVALSWLEDETTDLVEQFIGIVRGRTVNSTRGRPPATTAPAPRQRPEADARKPSAGRAQQRGAGSPRGGKRGKPRR